MIGSYTMEANMGMNMERINDAIGKSDALWRETVTIARDMDSRAGIQNHVNSPMKAVISAGKFLGDTMLGFLAARGGHGESLPLSAVTRTASIRSSIKGMSLHPEVFAEAYQHIHDEDNGAVAAPAC